MPRLLTETVIKAAAVPASGATTIWDGSLRNFGLRISHGGAKTFIVLVASGRRKAIGRYPTISLSEARAEARKLLAEKTLGKIRPTRMAFEDAKEEFLSLSGRKPRTDEDYRRLLNRCFTFARKPIADISSAEILKKVAAFKSTPAEQIKMFAVGRAFFRWATRQRYVDRSPMELMRLPAKTVARERILADQEIAAVWRAAAEYPFGTIVRLLILTGQRRGEIAALEWDWIDERTVTLPAWLTKNKRTHSFPLGELAAGEICQLPRFGKYLFPAARDRLPDKPATIFNGWSKAKLALDARAGVTNWAIHDLRRTFSSGLASLGVAQVVVEKLLNHVSGGTLSPIAQVYNRYSYLDEQKAAVSSWEGKLQTLLNSQ